MLIYYAHWTHPIARCCQIGNPNLTRLNCQERVDSVFVLELCHSETTASEFTLTEVRHWFQVIWSFLSVSSRNLRLYLGFSGRVSLTRESVRQCSLNKFSTCRDGPNAIFCICMKNPSFSYWICAVIVHCWFDRARFDESDFEHLSECKWGRVRWRYSCDSWSQVIGKKRLKAHSIMLCYFFISSPFSLLHTHLSILNPTCIRECKCNWKIKNWNLASVYRRRRLHYIRTARFRLRLSPRWLQNRPDHPSWHSHWWFGMQTPCRHGFLHEVRCWLPISQWLPPNPSGHRHLLLPMHLPPFVHGITHRAAKQRFSFIHLNALTVKKITYRIHNAVRSSLSCNCICPFEHISRHSSIYPGRFLSNGGEKAPDIKTFIIFRIVRAKWFKWIAYCLLANVFGAWVRSRAPQQHLHRRNIQNERDRRHWSMK